MGTLEKRLENLEKIADPPKLEPLILYCSGATAAKCAEMNAKGNPRNNPLMMEIRPYPEEAKNGNG